MNKLRAPSNTDLLKSLRLFYQEVSWRRITTITGTNRNILYRVRAAQNHSYVVKVFRKYSKNRLTSSVNAMRVLSKLYSFVAPAQTNKAGTDVSFVKRTPFIVYPYRAGQVFRKSSYLSDNHLRQAAGCLAELHNLAPISKISNDYFRHELLTKTLHKGINIYQMIIKTQQKKSLGSVDRLIQKTMVSRLRDVSTWYPEAMRLCKQSSPTLIHGDFAPSNMVFGIAGSVSIIDWEHARVFSKEYDLFRAIGNFSVIGHASPFDSKKDGHRMNIFLKQYITRRLNITDAEHGLLRLMPKMYCFLDTYVVDEVYLRHNNDAKIHLSTSRAGYAWWTEHEKEFRRLLTPSIYSGLA